MRVPLFTILLSAAAAACGVSDDSGPPPCDEAEQIEEEAVTEFCADQTTYCCYCACWDDAGGNFDSGLFYTAGTCECTFPSGSSSSACEGDVAAAAEVCLDDEASCAEVAEDVAEALCEDSLLP